MVQIQVRPAVAEDADALRALVAGLSPRSAFLRFCAGVGTPGSRLVAALLRQDDTHGAWVAAEGSGLLGHMSWAVVDQGVVELGAVVADRWQRHGLGRALVEAGLRHAAARGSTGVRLHVHGDNRTLVSRLAAGAAWVRREDEAVVIDRPIADLLTTRRGLVLVA